jgi:hypothetical protein
MRKHTQHPDEHMALYEWCGAGTGGAGLPPPAESKRSHPWHASYGVLTVLTSLLLMYGCDDPSPAGQAGDTVDQVSKDLVKESRSIYENTMTESGSTKAAAENVGQPGEIQQEP